MARRSKVKRRRERQRARPPRLSIEQEVARTMEREGITAENWREKIRETIVEPRAMAENFAAYVEANADKQCGNRGYPSQGEMIRTCLMFLRTWQVMPQRELGWRTPTGVILEERDETLREKERILRVRWEGR